MLRIFHDSLGIVFDAKEGNCRFEIVERIKALIYTREPQIRDLVQLAQRCEDGKTDVICFNLRCAGGTDGFLHSLSEHREIGVRNGPALARLSHSRNNLFATERLYDTAALDDVETRGLRRAESPSALGALTSAANGQTVITRTRVNDARVRMAAKRAEHCAFSLRQSVGIVAEPRDNRIGVRGEVLGTREVDDLLSHLCQSGPVIPDYLLRAKKRVDSEA